MYTNFVVTVCVSSAMSSRSLRSYVFTPPPSKRMTYDMSSAHRIDLLCMFASSFLSILMFYISLQDHHKNLCGTCS